MALMRRGGVPLRREYVALCEAVTARALMRGSIMVPSRAAITAALRGSPISLSSAVDGSLTFDDLIARGDFLNTRLDKTDSVPVINAIQARSFLFSSARLLGLSLTLVPSYFGQAHV